MGAVFLCFGVLKFFPEASPAEGVAVRTATKLTFGLLPPDALLRTLAVAETAIGLGLVTGVLLRVALAGFFAHMTGVFSALLLLPGEMWQEGVPVPTLEGQYVIKNVALVAACLVVAADERGRPAPRGRPGRRSARRRPAPDTATPAEQPANRPPSGRDGHEDAAVTTARRASGRRPPTSRVHRPSPRNEVP
ncbi:DUF417 domain-containing protein [Streptomyces sp. NPDC001744]|uniref:DUF417 domain-containing protein n=1 Tax=Streptomyces sp. NPDC001744 TaxID=3364606 RepID=UPI00368C88F7